MQAPPEKHSVHDRPEQLSGGGLFPVHFAIILNIMPVGIASDGRSDAPMRKRVSSKEKKKR